MNNFNIVSKSAINFVKANENDISSIQKMAYETWNHSYTKMLHQNQIDYMLNLMYSEEKIQLSLNNQESWEIIHYEKNQIGFLHFYSKDNMLFLSKIYILPQMQGKGIAKIALDFIVNQAQNLHVKFIELTVNKNNQNAINAYRKFGFETYKSVIFDIGSGYVMDDFILRLHL